MKNITSLLRTRFFKSPVFIGAFLLTLSGVLSRILGFLYRIFLSREIGAENLGLYQLTVPIFGLCISVCASGMQSAISRFVAAASGAKKEKENAFPSIAYLYAGLTLSITLSVLFCILIHQFSGPIAQKILGNPDCEPLLRLISYCLIPASIHACINGYYFGKKKAAVPSICQLAEQTARVFGVYLLYLVAMEHNRTISAVDAVWGLLFGELCSSTISITVLSISKHENIRQKDYFAAFPRLLTLAIPLTLNQTLTHLSSSVENVLIPQKLQEYGCSVSEAFSIYGVFSGMVVSVIFFPCVLTNSVSVMLLPTISEANACNNSSRISKTITAACVYGTIAGICFSIFFSCFGNWIGTVIFENELAGHMILRLGWICPLLFVYSLLSSVLNGLGESKNVLYISLLASAIRIAMIYLLVPRFGMDAALWGMLIGQLFAVVAALFVARSKASSLSTL